MFYKIPTQWRKENRSSNALHEITVLRGMIDFEKVRRESIRKSDSPTRSTYTLLHLVRETE